MKTEEKPFKQCPSCFQARLSGEAFLSDKSLSLNGYKADFEKLECGLFFFTHLNPPFNSTMGIEVSDFIGLYRGARYTERRTGEEDCPGYYLDKNQLEYCNVFCECVFVRKIIQIVKNRPVC